MTHSAWFDGATLHENPGQIGVGAAIRSHAGALVWSVSKPLGRGTSNEAEWLALLEVLEAAVALDLADLVVYGDSQLVVNQMNGVWQVKQPHLRPLKRRADALVARLRGRFTCKWVPREKNGEADALSKAAFDFLFEDQT